MAPKSLKKVYFDPKRVGSYGGVDVLRRVTHAPRKIVAQWLSEQDAYSLHKPARRRFKRRCVIVGGMNQQWQADLVDLTTLKDDNDGMTFLLTIIDVFSKRARCIPIPNKSAASMVTALQIAFADDRPQTLQTDQGMEFLNKSVQAFFKKRGVHHFSMHNAETKASIVERFNRSFVEDAHVALLHETSDVALHRRPSRPGANVQRHPPPQHRYGSVAGQCKESRKGVATSVRTRR